MNIFTVAAVFSNHCVLQRNKEINIFGTINQDCIITVTLLDKAHNILSKNKKEFHTSTETKWIVQLEKQTEQEECTLKVDCFFTANNSSKAIIYEDISIGEVWIAGGQSNMEFELQNCTEGPKELKSKNAGKNVRFYYTNKIAWMDEKFYEAEKNTEWQTWDSAGKASWSAIGYLFAKDLAAELKCTVGIIGCNWGGTSASAWMDEKYLSWDKELNTYITDQEEAVKGKTIEQQIKEYEDYEVEAAKWNEQYSKLWEKDHNISWETAEKTIGKNPWPGPKSCKNPYRPCGLYKTMLSRITPYSTKGVLWYQGESDDHKPNMYNKLFATMIQNWRDDFMDSNLPFIFVQLPNHRYMMDKDFKQWCLIREQQQQVFDTIKNTWMAVALDKGQFNDIHPKSKADVAQRMEKIAVEKIYKNLNTTESISPMLESTLVLEDKMILSFSNAEKGFEFHKDETTFKEYVELEKIQKNQVSADFTGFEIAGADKKFFPASYKFGKGKNANTIILSSPMVLQPVYARYAWFNYSPVTIFNKEKLPLAPFRTSKNDGEQTTEHAAIQQIMTVAN